MSPGTYILYRQLESTLAYPSTQDKITIINISAWPGHPEPPPMAPRRAPSARLHFRS